MEAAIEAAAAVERKPSLVTSNVGSVSLLVVTFHVQPDSESSESLFNATSRGSSSYQAPNSPVERSHDVPSAQPAMPSNLFQEPLTQLFSIVKVNN